MDWRELCVSLLCCRSYQKEDSIRTQPVIERKGPLSGYASPLRGYGAIRTGQLPHNMSINSESPAVDDKKSYSRRNYVYIRPPNVQRDNQAQVTLKGWLFRLEGGPLRQWKRRWFVLADYCLFYYKDPEEDRLLGSVILPSYRISPCAADDKITRKFSFKAEHQNMKTYFFAAESRELMIQWMNALCLATIMQTFTRRHSSIDQLSMPPTPGLDEEEDSGFTSYQSRKLQDREDPRGTLNSSCVSTQFSCDQSTQDLPRDIEGNVVVVNDGTNDSGFLSSSERYLSQYGSQSVIQCSVSPRGKTGHSYYSFGPPKPKRLHASCMSLPQGAPDLVPPQDIIPGMGRFVLPCDQKRFYDSDKYNLDSKKYNNWGDEYTYWTWQGDGYYEQQPQRYLYISQELNPGYELWSRQRSPQDYENSNIYRNSAQPVNIMAREPLLPRPHSDKLGNMMLDLDQSPEMPSLSDVDHSPQLQHEMEKEDSNELLDRIAQDPSYLYDLRNGRKSGNISSEDHLKSVFDSYYRSTSNLRGQQYQSAVGSSQYIRSATDTDSKVLATQMHQTANSHGLVSAHPMFINENIYEPFDSRRQEQIVLVPHHSMKSDVLDIQRKAQQEESIKRFMEWKERMLPSPMAEKQKFERNRSGEFATSNESPGLPPPRPPLPETYCQQVLQDIENLEVQQKVQEFYLQNNQTNKAVHSNHFSPSKSNGNHEHSEALYKPRRISYGEAELETQQQVRTPSEDRRETDKNQKTNKPPLKTQESPPSSVRIRESSRPKVRRTSWRGKSPGHRKAVGRAIMSDSELHVHRSSKIYRLVQHSSALSSHHKSISISAGELLEKTHEELVLFLIQLRQSQMQLSKSREQCQMQMINEQRMGQVKPHEKDHQTKYMKLYEELEDLQEQYELLRPLINLVENLVKLGTLSGATERKSASLSRLERVGIEKYIPSEKMLEFAHHLQERQKLRGEIEGVEMITIDSEGLEEKLSRLYQLDCLVQEESSHFASLQNDKEMLEQALNTVQEKLNERNWDSPVEMEKLRKQQRLIEKELSHIRSLLSQSAMRLEERTSEVCKVEHKILVLRQKIQHALTASHRRKEMSSISKADLETELLRVQNFLESLSKRRQEISNVIETLKIKSKHKQLPSIQKVREGASGVIGSATLPPKRKHRSAYMETDLDSSSSHELGVMRKPETTSRWERHYVNTTEISQQKPERTVVSHSGVVQNDSLLNSTLPTNVYKLANQDHQVRVNHRDRQTPLYLTLQQRDLQGRLNYIDQAVLNQKDQHARLNPQNHEQQIQSEHVRINQASLSDRNNLHYQNLLSWPSQRIRLNQPRLNQHDNQVTLSQPKQQICLLDQRGKRIQPELSRRISSPNHARPDKPDQNERLHYSNLHGRQNQLDEKEKLNQNCYGRSNQPDQNGILSQLNYPANPTHLPARLNQPEHHIRQNQPNQNGRHNQSEQPSRHKQPDNSGKLHQSSQPNQEDKFNELDQNISISQPNQHVKSNQPDHHSKLNQNTKTYQPTNQSRINQPDQHFKEDQSEQHKPQPDQHINVDKSAQQDKFYKADVLTRPHQQDQETSLTQPEYHLGENQPSSISPLGLPQSHTTTEEARRASDSCLSDTKQINCDNQAEVRLFVTSDCMKSQEEVKPVTAAETTSPHRPTSLFSPTHTVQIQRKTLSAHERLFGGASTSPLLTSSTEHKSSSHQSLISPRLHGQLYRKPKRRHHTITGTGSQQFLDQSSPRMFGPSSRHFHMDRCSRTASTPDIVRSTIRKTEVFDERIIDRELGLPQKIDIPERYIEDEPEKLSAAEKIRRNQKAENIRKMLSEATAYEEPTKMEGTESETMIKKVNEEKKKRAHLLALNHTIAKEVMERSKLVAMIATLERLDPDTVRQKEEEEAQDEDDEDFSPVQPLPVIQQRENYLT
ncbi:uncharacterized protein LOC106459913 isoform X2 [Limulus polyphemus]|uniref:Uncharacterized protein LOC106459913 isoform X2 n=1 Tax=Limulus polyphemus TaxID=6850 RepID=A0ABM1SEY9_LIMPO|nr:uncharacterized protein LOC106459913 isoform X2 [Limulus polyphemus]